MYQIGHKNAENQIRWDGYKYSAEEMKNTLTANHAIADGLIQGSLWKADRMGEHGVWVNRTHKIRSVK